MKRLSAAAVLLLFVVAAGCGTGTQGATRDERLVLAALRRLDDATRKIQYREEIEGQTVVVEGEVQDDFRYGGTVNLNGTDVYRHLVVDDAAALTVIAPADASSLLESAKKVDDIAAADLAAKKWVMDPTGAPRLTRGSAELRPVGVNPVLDAVEFAQYAQKAVSDAAAVGFWAPEGIDYNPLDDPWREDADADLSDKGIRRFDIVQPPLPLQGGAAGRTVIPPGPRHFRKMAFYMKGNRIVEIREQISFTDRREYRRAKEGRAPEAVIETIEAAKDGVTEDPVRERRLTVRFRYEDVSLDIPPDAVAGSLGSTLEGAGIGSLFKTPEPVSGARRPRATDDGSPATTSPATPSPATDT